jgi:hypothetical protein
MELEITSDEQLISEIEDLIMFHDEFDYDTLEYIFAFINDIVPGIDQETYNKIEDKLTVFNKILESNELKINQIFQYSTELENSGYFPDLHDEYMSFDTIEETNIENILDKIESKNDMIKYEIDALFHSLSKIKIIYNYIFANQVSLEYDDDNIKVFHKLINYGLLLHQYVQFYKTDTFPKLIESFKKKKESKMEEMDKINKLPNVDRYYPFNIELRPEPNNALKHLYVHISVHGTCSINTNRGFSTQTFVPPKFTNFKYIRAAPIGTVEQSYESDFDSKKYVEDENGNITFIPRFINKYDNEYLTHLQQPYEVNELIIEPTNSDRELDENEKLLHDYDKYYKELNDKNLTLKEFINPKRLINKTFSSNGTENTHQITFIIDKNPPILLEFYNNSDSQLTLYNKYENARKSTKRKRTHDFKTEFTLKQLLEYIYYLGFRDVEAFDSSCSVLRNKKGKHISPYDEYSQKIIKKYEKYGGTRKKKKNKTKKYKNKRRPRASTKN